MSQSNLELFRADPASDQWKAYIEYIDDMIIDGFFNSIECSLKFFLDNTGRTIQPLLASGVMSLVLLLLSHSHNVAGKPKM